MHNFRSYHKRVVRIIPHEFLELLHHTLLQPPRSVGGEIRLDQRVAVPIVAPHLQNKKHAKQKTLTNTFSVSLSISVPLFLHRNHEPIETLTRSRTCQYPRRGKESENATKGGGRGERVGIFWEE